MDQKSITEAIKKRRSVRSFSGKPLSSGDVESINHFITSLETPFNADVRVQLVRGERREGPIKLGTYGVIKGASDFLLLIYKEGFMAEEAAGYLFKEVVLHCTNIGLGTCWLGGTFNRKQFGYLTTLKEGEKMRIVSPVGYPAEKSSVIESLMRAGARSDTRKPFGSLFFDTTFTNPLTEENAGKYYTPLEMVRLSPSASNSQPWRVVINEQGVHFYCKEISGFSSLDIGIALAHFELTCNEFHISGAFNIMNDIEPYPEKRCRYVTSWKSS